MSKTVEGLVYIATVCPPESTEKVERIEMVVSYRDVKGTVVLPPDGGEHNIVVPENEPFSIVTSAIMSDGSLSSSVMYHSPGYPKELRDIPSGDEHKPLCVCRLKLSEVLCDYFEDIPPAPVVESEPSQPESEPVPPTPAPTVEPSVEPQVEQPEQEIPDAPVDIPEQPVQ